MIAALEEVGRCPGPSCRILASAAMEFLRGIETGRVEPTTTCRKLAARVELELKRVLRDDSFSPDDDLLRALRESIPGEAAHEPGESRTEEDATSAGNLPIPKDTPLASTLTATAAILPLFSAKPREPRFTLEQRKHWDSAVEAVSLAWATQQTHPADWHPLRCAVIKLLEGALALEHPAPLKLAEALASALDSMEHTHPTPRRLTAMTATMELISEADFLEHDALAIRVEQLVRRLESDETGPRSSMVNALFVAEATDEIDDLRHALETVPPDIELLTEAALRLRHLAEPLDLAPLALAAFRFADTIAHLDPAALDHAPGRDDAQAWINAMECWIQAIGEGSRPELPTELVKRYKALQALLPT